MYEKIDEEIKVIASKASHYMKQHSKIFVKSEIKKAYEYAKKAHEWDLRLSGEPYISHPVAATHILLSIKPDIATIQACLLHDVIEDTPVSYKDIQEEFWVEVADLCSGMEKLSKVRYEWEERSIGSLRKMFVAMADDLRVIFIKLADRLHNMQTLHNHPKKHKRQRIALETLNIYAPIADRLGLYRIKHSLDEECFKILKPESYARLKEDLEKLEESKNYFKQNVKEEVTSLLREKGLKRFEVNFRVKQIYSVYKKMKRKWFTDVSELYDLYGIRIIVKDITTCYRVLWFIHENTTPLPGRFKDYIALPKPNWYRSLHTSVIGLLEKHKKQAAEIQIKTYEMMEYSDLWMAAHFDYKEKWSKISTDIDWVKDLKELTENLENNDFMDSLKIDIFKDRIFALTPKWDTKNLPQGSTPIDFAYSIHTDLWNHISIAKVNGKVYPLDKDLQSGDIVEIVTDKSRRPNPLWLSFVKTSKAKASIRASMRKEDKDMHRERGKEIVNKYLEKSGLEPLDKELSILKSLDGRINNLPERLSILEQIGNFSIAPSSLLRKILKTNNLIKKEPQQEQKKQVNQKPQVTEQAEEKTIYIGGEKDIEYRLWKCMQERDLESLDNSIVAHINSKWIITVHRQDCSELDFVNKERLINAFYEGDENASLFVDIEFEFYNKIWVLKELSAILFWMNINVLWIVTEQKHKTRLSMKFTLEIQENDYLKIDRLIDRVKFNLDQSYCTHKILSIHS